MSLTLISDTILHKNGKEYERIDEFKTREKLMIYYTNEYG